MSASTLILVLLARTPNAQGIAQVTASVISTDTANVNLASLEKTVHLTTVLMIAMARVTASSSPNLKEKLPVLSVSATKAMAPTRKLPKPPTRVLQESVNPVESEKIVRRESASITVMLKMVMDSVIGILLLVLVKKGGVGLLVNSKHALTYATTTALALMVSAFAKMIGLARPARYHLRNALIVAVVMAPAFMVNVTVTMVGLITTVTDLPKLPSCLKLHPTWVLYASPLAPKTVSV